MHTAYLLSFFTDSRYPLISGKLKSQRVHDSQEELGRVETDARDEERLKVGKAEDDAWRMPMSALSTSVMRCLRK